MRRIPFLYLTGKKRQYTKNALSLYFEISIFCYNYKNRIDNQKKRVYNKNIRDIPGTAIMKGIDFT